MNLLEAPVARCDDYMMTIRAAAGGSRTPAVVAAAYHGALGLIFLVSMWVRSAFPIVALAPAVHDDALFVWLADQIGKGNWLGEYNNLTHAKGIGYSLFLVANDFIGSPLKLAEHALYLGAALYLALLLGGLYRTRWASLATFALLAFIPIAWHPGASARVMREGLYITLSLLLLALAIRCFVLSKSASIAGELREKWLPLLLMGLVAGLYWLTREEGVWLLPSLAITVSYWFWSRRLVLRPWRATLQFLALPLLPALLVIGTVNALNYHWYGVFRNNDFRSADFLSAYGALSRIRHDQRQLRGFRGCARARLSLPARRHGNCSRRSREGSGEAWRAGSGAVGPISRRAPKYFQGGSYGRCGTPWQRQAITAAPPRRAPSTRGWLPRSMPPAISSRRNARASVGPRCHRGAAITCRTPRAPAGRYSRR
ncbi:MAG: hypothetical protein IPM40_20390 [Gammaproteobacteria bacterium]|nr:hypothetical protein [Gammaproteobacteria bacterium]